ncbi:hypothetical protein [Thiohalomonas denitrificans]|uniref:hypothetical protein n=1 Tax=Thiohalomonas denitrificans TaxID=415747 RepID=UPI0026F2340A|nr:hypothetical protein [Thiohalomonas denitrificans]
MNDSNDSGWHVDRSKNIVSHIDGFSAEMVHGQVRNILRLPPDTAAREISRYLSGAEKAWADALPAEAENAGPSAIARLIGNGPKLRPNVPPPPKQRTWSETYPPAPISEEPGPKSRPEPIIKVKRRKRMLKPGSEDQ